MRIISLKIGGYKLFKPSPKIRLGKEMQLLIGVNGSGKSTVLEAIAIIFSDVKRYCEDTKRRERKFDFYIEYSFVNNYIIEETSTTQDTRTSINHVFLSSSFETGLEYAMFVNKIKIETPQEMYKYLPDNLILYYSGSCDTLEKIAKEIEAEQAEDLFRNRSKEQVHRVINSLAKNIIYIKKEYYPLLFALNYIDKKQVLPLSNKKFQISSIVFYIKKPNFTDNNDYKKLYNLSGFLRPYLNNLLKHSYGVDEDIETKEPFFIVDYHRGILEAVEELDGLTHDQRFNQTRYIAFHLISLLFRVGLIKKIDISISDMHENKYSIDNFSEGEQQLIILDALKNILCLKNSILCLDEPDAYLHPKRQRELFPHIQELYTESETQIIATSHSPFVAQSVPLNSILLFNKNGGVVKVIEDELNSYIAIANELFGVKTEFSVEIENEFEKFWLLRQKILSNESYNTQELIELIKILQSRGDEVKAIVNRELAQLRRVKGNEFFI